MSAGSYSKVILLVCLQLNAVFAAPNVRQYLHDVLPLLSRQFHFSFSFPAQDAQLCLFLFFGQNHRSMGNLAILQQFRTNGVQVAFAIRSAVAEIALPVWL